MFDMELPWWEFVVRGVIIYIALLVMVRVSGRRTVGQFTPFDLLIVMLLSEAVSSGLTGGDESLAGGLIVAATLVALKSLIAVVAVRNTRFEHLVDGRAVLIGRDGVFFDDVTRRCKLSQSDIEEALREHDCPRPEMKCAFLEADGGITILRNPQ
ncbi:DUF421 domain-containing protein [Massilia consociata]|uniref:DUF421 domain-containing protein n=1 Tax=Massilia consociata TaxID=760117 RepID=A0ABV6FJA6_9BURK